MEINSMIEKFAALERLEYLTAQSELRSLNEYEIDEIKDLQESIEYFTVNN